MMGHADLQCRRRRTMVGYPLCVGPQSFLVVLDLNGEMSHYFGS